MIERIYVEIGNICNMNCSFCPGTRRSPRQMSAEEFEIVAKRLSGRAKYVYLHVMGEPLIHRELSKILVSIRENGLRACLTTNGTLIKQRSDELIDRADVLHKTSISLHSFEANDIPGGLSEYVKNISNYAKRASDAGIYTVLRLWNADSEDRLGKNQKNAEIEALLRKEFPEEWQARRQGFRLMRNVFLEYAEIFDWPSESRKEPKIEGRCHGMIDQLAVLADGTVVPCCLDSEGEISLGNIFDSELDEILKSPRAVKMKKGLESGYFTEELCQKCSYARRFAK